MSGIVQRPRDDTHHRHGMALHKWAGILLSNPEGVGSSTRHIKMM